MKHLIIQVNGIERANDIRAFNDMFPKEFLPLEDHHLEHGIWWLVYPEDSNQVVGFAGMVPMVPFPRVGYLKRTAVHPSARGHGIQRQMIEGCVEVAKDSTDWEILVSSSEVQIIASAASFISAGWKLTSPERPWEENSLYWIKKL